MKEWPVWRTKTFSSASITSVWPFATSTRPSSSIPRSSGEENAKIQLLAPLNENSTIAKWLDRNGGPGIQQLAYRVHDLDHVSAVLRERGLRLLFPEAKRGTADSRINFVHPKDAGGVLLELVEPAKNASH